jgi:multimeric flavodoxin WrbA
MKVIAINGSYQRKGTTTKLAQSALDGAASVGAETEMIMLRDCDIAYCTNCLTCYKNLESEIAPCCMKDDVDEIVEKLRDADGSIWASPVHNGFVTGLMVVLQERISWRVLRPMGPFLGGMGMESRLSSKVRAVASIASAGGMSPKLGEKYCNDGTPWLKGNLPLQLHAQWIGDVYAGAVLKKQPDTPSDWANIYFLRKLAVDQLEKARALGVKMAEAIKAGGLTPVTLNDSIGPIGRGIAGLMNRFRPHYQTV